MRRSSVPVLCLVNYDVPAIVFGESHLVAERVLLLDKILEEVIVTVLEDLGEVQIPEERSRDHSATGHWDWILKQAGLISPLEHDVVDLQVLAPQLEKIIRHRSSSSLPLVQIATNMQVTLRDILVSEAIDLFRGYQVLIRVFFDSVHR